MNRPLLVLILVYTSLHASIDITHLDTTIKQAIKDKIFPGAVILIGQGTTSIYHRAYGHLSYENDAPPITTDTLFDCASLTKVIATTTAAMLLAQQNLLSPEDYVSDYLDSFKYGAKSHLQIKHVLTHTSGMPPYLDPTFIAQHTNAHELLDCILSLDTCYPRGTFVYSCLNFVILKTIIEKISHQPFIEFVKRTIFIPLGMHHTIFSRHVHDPLAHAFALSNDTSGNAGLFSTAQDIGLFMQALTAGDNSFIDHSIVDTWTTNQIGAGNRGYGWAIAPDKNYSCGDSITKNSFGHLGFTGTSIWYDIKKKIYVIFLCNRLCPHEGLINGPEQCSAFRRRLHTIIFQTTT